MRETDRARLFHAYGAATDTPRHLAALPAVHAARFADPRVAVVHVRAVEYGCFLFEAVRTP
ncbi:DUF1203 domain-containing protein [Actinacidiphila glaucinigra]|uniref:DUF1203 domain-containing protein n=1 Tax=Actinacidiphila glaucinigra TaxID=235986 RepID=UPI003AF35F72